MKILQRRAVKQCQVVDYRYCDNGFVSCLYWHAKVYEFIFVFHFVWEDQRLPWVGLLNSTPLCHCGVQINQIEKSHSKTHDSLVSKWVGGEAKLAQSMI